MKTYSDSTSPSTSPSVRLSNFKKRSNMRKNLKILTIIGVALVALCLLFTTGDLTQFIMPTTGVIVLGAYAWGKFNDRTIMLWMSGFFTLCYVFLNLSYWDLLFWVLVFIFVYRDKE
jgi:hypothetical protein